MFSEIIRFFVIVQNVTNLCQSQAALYLTIQLERLSHIGPEEFVEAFTKEQSPLETSIKKTRNLESYVDWFNRLSFLVCTDVIKVNHLFKFWRKKIIVFPAFQEKTTCKST